MMILVLLVMITYAKLYLNNTIGSITNILRIFVVPLTLVVAFQNQNILKFSMTLSLFQVMINLATFTFYFVYSVAVLSM